MASKVIGLFLTVWFPVQAFALDASMVQICDDGEEWPPFTYYQRVEGKPSRTITGFSVDVIRSILNKHRIPFTITLLPWKRCLGSVENGETYAMALSVSKNPDREKKYLFSTAYYKTHYYVFYSKAKFQKGLGLKSQADLNNFRLGGVKGYAYSALSFIDKSKMILANSYPDLVRMMKAGRLDVFAEDYEVMAGMASIGVLNVIDDDEIGRVPLPGMGGNPFHMIFSRVNPRGVELLNLVNSELEIMRQSGELSRMLAIYVKQ